MRFPAVLIHANISPPYEPRVVWGLALERPRPRRNRRRVHLPPVVQCDARRGTHKPARAKAGRVIRRCSSGEPGIAGLRLPWVVNRSPGGSRGGVCGGVCGGARSDHTGVGDTYSRGTSLEKWGAPPVRAFIRSVVRARWNSTLAHGPIVHRDNFSVLSVPRRVCYRGSGWTMDIS